MLESAGCEHCVHLALRMLRSRLAVLRISASYQGWEARAAVSSAPIEAHTLQLSDSEELDATTVRLLKLESNLQKQR